MYGNWFFTRDGKHRLGPLTFEQLYQLAATGQLAFSDMVIQEGSRQWVEAGSIPGLFSPPLQTPLAPQVVPVDAEEPPAQDDEEPEQPLRMRAKMLWIAVSIVGGLSVAGIVLLLLVAPDLGGKDTRKTAKAATSSPNAGEAQQVPPQGPERHGAVKAPATNRRGQRPPQLPPQGSPQEPKRHWVVKDGVVLPAPDDPATSPRGQTGVASTAGGLLCLSFGAFAFFAVIAGAVVGIVFLVRHIIGSRQSCPKCKRGWARTLIGERVIEEKKCYGLVTRRAYSSSSGSISGTGHHWGQSDYQTVSGSTYSSGSTTWKERVPVIRTTYLLTYECKYCRARWTQEKVEQIEDFDIER